MKSIFFIVIFVSSSIAHAAEWYLLDVNTERGAAYFISATNKSVVKTKIGWVKVINSNKTSQNSFKSTMSKYAFHCGNRSVQRLASIQYDKYGDATYSDRKTYQPEEIIPETVGEMFFLAACENKWYFGDKRRIDNPEAFTKSFFDE